MKTVFRSVVLPAEHEQLKAMWEKIFPEDPFFGEAAWREPLMETYWVLVDAKKVGFIIFQHDATVASRYEEDILPYERGTIYLLMIGFLEEHRRKGLGKEVIEWLITYAKSRKDVQRLTSNLREGNKQSLKFHEATGFEPIGRIVEYYPDGEAAIILEQSIYH